MLGPAYLQLILGFIFSFVNNSHTGELKEDACSCSKQRTKLDTIYNFVWMGAEKDPHDKRGMDTTDCKGISSSDAHGFMSNC